MVNLPYVAGGDFYPFGLTMDDRQIKSERYRFGYQGQFSEYDSLTKTNQFQLRLYDPRFGRWLSPDPYGIGDSPYIGMANNPVGLTDPDGGCPICGDLIDMMNMVMEDFSANLEAMDGFLSAMDGKGFSWLTHSGAEFERLNLSGMGKDLSYASDVSEATPSVGRSIDLSIPSPQLAPTGLNGATFFSAWEPSPIQQWGMSTSFIGSAKYSVADGVYLGLSFFTQPFMQATHLDGRPAQGWDKSDAFVSNVRPLHLLNMLLVDGIS